MASDREALPQWIAEMVEHARRRIPEGWTLENAPNNRNGDVLIAYLADRVDILEESTLALAECANVWAERAKAAESALAAPPSAQDEQAQEIERLRALIQRVVTASVAAIAAEPEDVRGRLYERCRKAESACWCGAHISHTMASPLPPPPAGAPRT